MFLVKITAFGFVSILWLRVSKLPLLWFLNCTNGWPLCSPAFSQSFLTNKTNCTNPYKTYVQTLWFLIKGIKGTNHLDSHGRPTYIVHDWLFCHDEQGIGYPRALYLDDPVWWSSIVCCFSLGVNTVSTSKKINSDFLIFLLEHKRKKEIWIPTLFGCSHAHFRIRILVLLLDFFQPLPPLQGRF